MELRIERGERVVGNIYKGIVQNVLPGMDAAFVDIGLERNAFLYVADILPESEDGEPLPASVKRSTLKRRNIKDLLKQGQEVLVQVIKGPRGTKGARVSTRLTLPGRYVVLMPEGNHLGVSRKIESREERERLRQIGLSMHPDDFGVIIRTESEGKGDEEIRADIEFLRTTWQQIMANDRVTRAPGMIYRDMTLLYRTIRDMFGADVQRLMIDDPDEYEKVYHLVKLISPKMANHVQLYDRAEPIFDHYGVEKEMERLLRRKVWMKSGGYLSIDETEAISAIDVNTGKFVGTSSLADTIVRANLEAVDEACRQLRLRDIGGIIVIDFIDMANIRDRKAVMTALIKMLAKDRAKTRIGRISSLGLVELTRKRTGESVTDAITAVCPSCHGRGRVPSAETMSLWLERDLRRELDQQGDAFFIEAHPDVVEAFVGTEGENVEGLEHVLRRGLYIRAREDFGVDKYTIVSGRISDFDKQYANYKRAQVIECSVVASESTTSQPPKIIGWSDGFYLELSDGHQYVGKHVKVCLQDVRRSYATAEIIQPGSSTNSAIL